MTGERRRGIINSDDISMKMKRAAKVFRNVKIACGDFSEIEIQEEETGEKRR